MNYLYGVVDTNIKGLILTDNINSIGITIDSSTLNIIL